MPAMTTNATAIIIINFFLLFFGFFVFPSPSFACVFFPSPLPPVLCNLCCLLFPLPLCLAPFFCPSTLCLWWRDETRGRLPLFSQRIRTASRFRLIASDVLWVIQTKNWWMFWNSSPLRREPFAPNATTSIDKNCCGFGVVWTSFSPPAMITLAQQQHGSA